MPRDDDEGFGEFTFASPPQPLKPNHTVHLIPNHINGPDLFENTGIDDEWSDFVNSSSLSRTDSLPNNNNGKAGNESEPTQPDTAPSRIESTQWWVKPNGALPLSIFGGAEEEKEGSDAADRSFNFATGFNSSSKSNNNVNLGFNDLIANLYKQNHEDKPNNGLKQDSGLNGLDLNKNISNLDAKDGNLSLNGLSSNLNTNGLNLNTSGLDLNANGRNLDSNGLNSNINWSNFNSDGLNLNTGGWNSHLSGLNLNKNAVNSDNDEVITKPNGFDSSRNGFNLDLNSNANENFEAADNGDDDGWEFKSAESKTGCVNEVSEVKTENGPNLNLNGPNLSLNMLSPDLTRLNSNFDGTKSDSNQLNADRVDVDYDFADDDGWEFKGAASETTFKDRDTKVDSIGLGNPQQFECTSGFGDVANGISDLFSTSEATSQKSGEWGFGFEFKPTSVREDGSKSGSYSASQQNNMSNGINSSPVIGGVDFKEVSWAFNDSLSEIGSKDKEDPEVATTSPIGVEQKGALPLSIFGEEEVETDDPLPYQDVSTDKPISKLRDDTGSMWSNISINDLISNLYSQAQQNAGASHTQNPGENDLGSSQTVVDSKLVGGDDDFDDGSWEFKGAFSGAGADGHTSISAFGDSQQNCSAKVVLHDYMNLFSKLKDELSFLVLSHLENLKKARSDAALSGEDAKVKALDDEIQDCHKGLQQEGMISKEVHLENAPPRSICLSELVEILKEQKFQCFESDYHLSERLSSADKDSRSAVELLKHATSTLKILTMGSIEEQSNYVSTWFKMLSVCLHELRHGALIWKHSLEKKVHGQILSKPQGKRYILALGEIYRVVEVLGSSAKLYKPWILFSANTESIFNLLSECYVIWSSSGLEEALKGISDPTILDYGGTPKALLESIENIHALDALALHQYAFSGQEPQCQLSLLTAEAVPGMKMVVWNGENYFLTLANLWANLVSKDPPYLPCTQGS